MNRARNASSTPQSPRAGRPRALRGLFVVLTAFVLAAYGIAVIQQWHEARQDADTDLAYIKSLLVQNTRATLTHHELVLRGLGGELVTLGALQHPERGRDLIERMKAVDPGMAGFGLARPDGQLVLVSGVAAGGLPNLAQSPETRDSFLKTLSTGLLQTGRPYFMEPLGQWVIPIRVAIRDAGGRIQAVMTAGYTIEGGTTAMANLALPAEIFSVLLREDGYVQHVHPLPSGPRAQVLQRLYGEPLTGAIRDQVARLPGQSGLARIDLIDRDGLHYVAYERLPEYGLIAGAILPRQVVVQDWLTRLIVPSLLLFAFLAGGTWAYRRSLALQTASDAQVDSLTAWQQAMLDGADYGIIATDTQGTVVSFNAAAQRMLGYAAGEVVGRITLASLHDPAQIESRALELTKALGVPVEPGFEVLVAKARQGEAEEREWTYIRKDGGRLPVRLSVTAVRDMQGEITGFMGIAADITASKRTEHELEAQKGLLQATIDALPGFFYLFDAEGRMIAWNRNYAETLGMTADQIGQIHALDVVHPDDVGIALESIRAVFESGEMRSMEIRMLARDGAVIPLLATIGRVMQEGKPCLVGTAVDLTARLAAEEALAKSRQEVLRRNDTLQLVNELSRRLHGNLEVEAIYQQTIQALLRLGQTNHVAIYELTKGGDKLVLKESQGFNEALRKTFGELSVDGTLSGQALAEGQIMYTSDLAQDERTHPGLRPALAAHHMHAAVLIPLVYGDRRLGVINLVFQQCRNFREMELETLGTLGKTVSLALANARHVDELERLAHHDTLTGLPNRLVLHREFARRVAGRAGRQATLFLLDLDRFKEINDTLGHYVGDLLLRQIGPRLQPLLEPRSGLLCRLGGDEFAILLPEARIAREEQDLARALLAALHRPFTINEMRLGVDASLGIAHYPRDGRDSHALLRSADVAMYEAKRKGGGVAHYDVSLDRNSPERLAMMADLDQAIQEGQLLLHYQPKYDLKQGRITGFEALVRWQHPRLGLLNPDAFLPLAEMSEAIHGLTERVLDMALAEQGRWQAAGHDYSVAVNLSARNLVDERFLANLQALMLQHGTRPGMLELEITETALMHDPERAAELLERIAALGVRLSIDDYGTGYSSLGYLHRLPIHALKIDRMFVRDMPANEHDAIIVRSTVAMAHNLGLEVLAEGVEDTQTEDILRGMGCDQIQGFHLSRPLPMQDLAAWLGTVH